MKGLRGELRSGFNSQGCDWQGSWEHILFTDSGFVLADGLAVGVGAESLKTTERQGQAPQKRL